MNKEKGKNSISHVVCIDHLSKSPRAKREEEKGGASSARN
jgi:hypothetical protein